MGVKSEICSLDWLAENYAKHKGKLIEISETRRDFLMGDADTCETEETNNSIIARLNWKGGEGVPPTQAVLFINGCRTFITDVKAEDIKDFGFRAGLKNDKIVFLHDKLKKPKPDFKNKNNAKTW